MKRVGPKPAEFRRIAKKALRASRRAEVGYVRDLRAIMAGVHRGVMQLLAEKVLPFAGPHVRHDADTPKDRAKQVLSPRLKVKIGKHVEARVGKAFDKMAFQVNRTNAAGTKLLGIAVSSVGVNAKIAEARAANIALISKAGGAYVDQMRQVLEAPENFQRPVGELAGLLEERGNVSASRAELIARTETLKLNAQINETRQTAVGVTSFVWSTSRDERVRPSHAELEGETFEWASPPIVDDEEATPGSPVQCRCVALPVIDDVE